MNFIKQCLKEVGRWISPSSWWAIYLGGSVGAFTGFHFTEWQWWAIVLPVILLNNFFKED